MMKTGLQQVLLVLVALQGGTAVADPTVKLVPETADFVAGNSYSVQLVMEGFPVTEGGGVNLAFNPSMLQVTDVQVDSETWGFVNHTGEIDNDSGRVSDIVFSDFSCIKVSVSMLRIACQYRFTNKLTTVHAIN